MLRWPSLVCTLLIFSNLFAQQSKIDSMSSALKSQGDDTNKVNALNRIGFVLYASAPDSAVSLGQKALTLAGKLNWQKGISDADKVIATGYFVLGSYAKATDFYSKALGICEKIGDKVGKAAALCNMGNVYNVQGNYAKALELYNQAVVMADQLGKESLKASICTNIGAICYLQGNYPQALDYYSKSLSIHMKNGNKAGEATVLGNIGGVYSSEGDYPKALDYYLKGLGRAEDLGDKQLQAKDLINIGTICFNNKDYQKALEYDGRALELANKLGNIQTQINVRLNMGGIYSDMKNYAKAIENEQSALQMARKIGDKRFEASSLANLGNDYSREHDYSQASGMYQSALQIAEGLQDKDEMARIIGYLGDLSGTLGKQSEAEAYYKRAIAIDSESGQRERLAGIEDHLSQLYKQMGRYQQALEWFERSKQIEDTIFTLDKNKALTRKEVGYEYQRKEDSTKADQDRKDTMAQAESKRQSLITRGVTAGLGLALALSIVIFRSLRVTRKQKRLIEIKNDETTRQKGVIEQQKREVEEKNKDILDSITYAKRLQDAIMPDIADIKKHLPDSFVLYKPKDIVAGDFYWMQRLDDVILIAACDCTGHGVPGALVSVVCSNALNSSLKEFGLRDTGKILDKVRELVLETFEKSDGKVQDGMDISFCAINTRTNAIEWSGAYNPLWFVQNGEMKELPADKQPIGKHDTPAPFVTHTFNLQKGDSLYLFTDGYADQFGGAKGKKFKFRQLQDLIYANHAVPMAEQGNILEKTLDTWKGKLDQVDDILVIGIKMS